MGIEDQSTQAYQTIGQAPSAPQLAPAQQVMGQLGQTGNTGQMPPPEAMKQYQEFLKQQQQNPPQFLQGMLARPAMPQPMPFMPQPMPAMRQMDRPFDIGVKPPQQDMYKPQFGMMATQLGGIADQLRRAGDNAMGNQIGKLGGGFGQTGSGLSGLGQLQSMKQPMQQQMMQPYQAMQTPKAMKAGGATGHEDLSAAAKHLASKGRGGDSMLIHINPQELKGIQAALKAKGYDLTYNPHTGLPEALFGGLKKLAKKAWSGIKSVATKARDIAQTGLNVATLGATKNLTSKGAQKNFQSIKDKVGPVLTKLRDVAESAAVLVGNYFVPGSSMLTSGLASKGSQKLLNSGIGQIAQFATGLGAGGGGGLSGIFKGGIKNLGSNLMKGASNIGSKLTGMFRGAGGLLNGLRTGQFTIGDVMKSTGNLIKSKFYNTAVKGVMGLQNLGTSIKGGIANLLNNPMGTLKNWGAKGLEFLKEKGTDVKNLLGKVLGGGQQGEGGEGEGGGVDWGNLLSGAAGAYFGSQAGGGGEGGGGAAGAPGGAPGASFYNTSFKRVLNPNYGKPGEPFYLTQEFGPSEFSNQYKEATAQDLKVTDQGLKPNDPAAVQAAAAQQAQAAQPAAPTSAQDFTFNVPVQAAHGGLMHGYAGGGMLPYSGGGDVYEYAAGGKLLDGPGDGMSDSIPAEIRGKKVQKALLADGEFVIPADVVSHLGNGSTKAGSKVLYSMMDRVRQARTGNPEQGKQIDANDFVPV